MGVPKFYKWISERFPCLSEVVKEYQIPDFDNLYLDMNGIVHICSHPEDNNPHFRITEEQIFRDIFHYIEVLFRMIKPKKVFFMAIDGVAPRAKMNQQRGRRFRSAREAEDLIRQALAKGEVLPSEERFDSNCITPGTKFMVKLQEQLKYFVVNKVSTDKLWQGPRIYLSGHETPGEGEHKIMDFIRSERARPDYDSNTCHCLYGLDADLIMLGMVTHDPHFSLLREEVRFGGKNSQKRSTTPEQTTFHLLHLQLLREYLDFEFSSLRKTLPFAYDLEAIIDDWVLMGFLVGNDFIPHLPHVHIHSEALPLLWRTYKDVLPTLDGYINEGGKLNLTRFEKYMTKLAEYDTDQFRDTYADLKWLEGKRGQSDGSRRRGGRQARKPKLPYDKLLTANQYMALVQLHEDEHQEGEDDSDGAEPLDLVALEKDLGVAPLEGENGQPGEEGEEEEEDEEEEEEEEEEEDEEESSEDDEDSMFRHEFRHHKDGYYQEKLNYEHVTPQILRDQAEGYVRAIQWILYYYYDGVPSWSWYYPHHYAPYISDVKNFSDMKITFSKGKPFLPFEQLMAVLPAASKKNVPTPLHRLMTDPDSPLIEYYPTDFETDLNGKMQEWEAVVLIPFIDEERLLEALVPVYAELMPEEAARNVHGPHFLYQFSPEPVGTYPSSLPGRFPDIVNHHAKVIEVPKDAFVLERDKLRKGLCPDVKMDVYYPGFPTLKHIPHHAHLEKANVVVFQQPSRYDNMIVEVDVTDEPDLEQVAQEYLGRAVFVNWPHMFEARVIAVSDGHMRYNLVENAAFKHKSRSGSSSGQKMEIQCESLDKVQTSMWNHDCDIITQTYKTRKGVDVGFTHILLYACPMTGRKYICGHRGNITLEKQWSPSPQPYSLQTSVKDIASKDPSFHQFHTLGQLFPVKAPVFMLGSPHYGCKGEVLDVDPKNDGRVRVEFTVLQKPHLEDIIYRERSIGVQYLPAFAVAQRLGINAHLLSRITGTVYVTKGSRNFQSGKTNVGLNLKFSKRNQEVAGYTKRIDTTWQYSYKTVDLLQEYIEKFPELFDFISKNPNNEDGYFEQDIFGDEDEDRLKELTKWLKELPCAKVPLSACGSLVLDEQIVAAIEAETDKTNEINQKRKKCIKLQVRPHLLYRPLPAQVMLVPDASVEYQLYDRVVNIREGYSVPLGLCGTVIGIQTGEKEQDSVYDVVYDEPFVGGLSIRCSANRGYQMPSSAMINLSHGERKEQAKAGNTSKPTAVVKPQATWSHGQNSNQGYIIKNQYSSTGSNGRSNRGGPSQSSAVHGGSGPANTQPFNSYQQLAARGKLQGHDLGRRPVPAGGHQIEENHANFWQQMQKPSSSGGGGSSSSAHNQPAKGGSRRNTNQSNANSRQAPQGAAQEPSQKAKPPSLAQAALALGKLPVSTTHLTTQKSDQSKKKASDEEMIHGQSDEFLSIMNSLEISAKSPKKKSSQPSVIVSSSKTHQEVLTVSDLEEEQCQIEEQQNKEGTAALYQMLKIGQPSKDSEDSHQVTASSSSQQPSAEPSSKSYGRQVTIEELFQGAKQKADGGSHQQVGMSSHPAPIPVNQRQAVPGMAAPQGHPQPGQQHHTGKRSRLVELQQWSSAMGMPPPRFDYNYGSDKRVSAVVTLANGSRYQGSMARNLEQAAESAASHALLSMHHVNMGRINMLMASHFMHSSSGPQQHSKGPGGVNKGPFLMAPPRMPSGPPSVAAPAQQQHQQQPPPRGTFCSSPNSAFTPVIPAGKGTSQSRYQGPNQRFSNPSMMPQQLAVHTRQPFQPLQLGQGQRAVHPGPRGPNQHQGHPGHGNQGHQGHGNQGHPGHGNQGHPGHGSQGHPGHGNQGHPGHGNQGHHQGHPQGHQGPPGKGWTPGSWGHRMPHHPNQHQRGPQPHHQQFTKGQQGKGHGSWDRWQQQGHGSHEDGQREKKGPKHTGKPESEAPKTPNAKNQFVPLQVMRQQKTPQRDTKAQEAASTSSEAPSSSNPSHPPVTPETKPASMAEKVVPDVTKSSSTKTPPQNSDSKSKSAANEQSSEKVTPSTKQRRQRSRLAANFGAAK